LADSLFLAAPDFNFPHTFRLFQVLNSQPLTGTLVAFNLNNKTKYTVVIFAEAVLTVRKTATLEAPFSSEAALQRCDLSHIKPQGVSDGYYR
jgi:hypothetical protein